MIIKDIVDENFQDYKRTSMFIATSECDWKCCSEASIDISICQNSNIAAQPSIEVNVEDIFNRYINNSLTSAIVVGGLEPFLQFDEVYELIRYFRSKMCLDEFVIYTGYYHREIEEHIKTLQNLSNIIIKFGRYIPNTKQCYSAILGVWLSSANQYALRIS